ncbi:uncharacterized protein LOC128730501 [Anopheles nili]|uniref:uncharacterized protein LOC128730501 n=1 Tax=Anopheles nili TaxID=185578 RepID=UPI00237B7D04|nr:uncharacterized protein LOC128730501 [Anopheles nili]
MARPGRFALDARAIVGALALLIAGCCALPAGDLPPVQEKLNKTEFFAYPAEQSAIELKQNARNRTPIFIPNKCAEDEILYPGDHEHDWVCDCKPTYIYDTRQQKCYQMYTQGSCQSGSVMYIEPKGKTAVCIENPCPDGKVQFMGECAVLNEEHRLCLLANIKLVVGINEDTHQLECVNISGVQFNRTMITQSSVTKV